MPFHSQKELSGPDATRIDSDISAGTFVDATFHFCFPVGDVLRHIWPPSRKTKLLYDISCLIAAWFIFYLFCYFIIYVDKTHSSACQWTF